MGDVNRANGDDGKTVAGKRLNVLIVEDSPLAAEAVVRSLRAAGYEVAGRVVDNAAEMQEALSGTAPDLIICDYVMPNFTAHDALRIYRQRGLDHPFICVSGEIGDEEAAGIIRAGAHGFVSKAHLKRLSAVVEGELIEARHRQERRQIAEQTSHLAAIVEGTADAIFSRDLDGTILSWNSAAEEMYGYKAAEVIGQNITLIVPPERTEELAEILEKLRRGERIARMETVRRRKDGSQLAVSLTISPVKDVVGSVIGASIIARDITERKRFEQERSKLIEELQAALSRVKQLSGLLPICANCKRIRDDKGHWEPVEVYIHERSQAEFTHGICPDCARQLYPGINLRGGK
jgi:PAS domain S-box-containing protein